MHIHAKCTHIYIYIYTFANIYLISKCVPMNIRRQVYFHIRTYIHACIHTYNSYIHCIKLSCVTLHDMTLHTYIIKARITHIDTCIRACMHAYSTVQYSTLHYTTLCYTTLHYTTLMIHTCIHEHIYICMQALYNIMLHYITSHDAT